MKHTRYVTIGTDFSKVTSVSPGDGDSVISLWVNYKIVVIKHNIYLELYIQYIFELRGEEKYTYFLHPQSKKINK